MRFLLPVLLVSALSAQTVEPKEDVFQPLRSLLDELVAAGELPGGTLLVRHAGEVVFAEGFGWATLEEKSFAADAPCALASLTKPITASLLVLLEAEGLLSLDEPVDTWLPAWAALREQGMRPPLLRECLAHTTGLPGNQRKREVNRFLPRDAPITNAAMADAILALGPDVAPGERYAYSRFGFDLAAAVVEVVTGQDYETALRERLLEPLGMEHTGFRVDASVREAMPTRYNRADGGFAPETREAPVPPVGGYVNAGGGLISTADDIGRFLQWHLDGGVVGGERLIPAEALAKTAEVQPATRGYGLGFSLTREQGRVVAKAHGGAAGTYGYVDLENGLVVVLLTQLPSAQQRGVRERIIARVEEVLLGADQVADFIAKHDANGDGLLSAEELPARLRRRFAAVDADGDGQVGAAELEQALARRAQR